MEKTIIIAPMICLPPMKEDHAKEREQGAAREKKGAKNKAAENKPQKGRKSTGK